MEIEPINLYYAGSINPNTEICLTREVRQLEADFKATIEALEEISIRIIKGDYPICLDRTSDNIIIIEKAYGEKWDDIRREK